MRLGVNWSGQRELPVLREVLSGSDVDFVELLVDNFLHTDLGSIQRVLEGRDCAFHIMNSQFLHKDIQALKVIAKLLARLSNTLKPIYISDHLGLFYLHGQALPQMLEVDYLEHKDLIFNQVDIWQSMLGCKLLLENYPSTIPQKRSQVGFYKALMNRVGCGLLFDVSNAVIAEKNVGEAKENWFSILGAVHNYHIAGFEECVNSSFLVDTHDRCIDPVTLDFLAKISNINEVETISVERDGNFIATEWSADIHRTRCQI